MFLIVFLLEYFTLCCAYHSQSQGLLGSGLRLVLTCSQASAVEGAGAELAPRTCRQSPRQPAV